jgi:hypothetical protein
MTKDNYYKKKTKKTKQNDRGTGDPGIRRNSKFQDVQTRKTRVDSYIPARRREIFPEDIDEEKLSVREEERLKGRQRERFQDGVGGPSERGGLSFTGAPPKPGQAHPRFAEPQPRPDPELLPLRQRQLLDLQQKGQLPSDLLPPPGSDDFAGGIQIKGIANLTPIPRGSFLRHPPQEEQQQIHQLPYQQSISPTPSWNIEWTPSPINMSPTLGMVVRNARDKTSGSGPSNTNVSAQRTNGTRRSKDGAGEDEEIPLVDAAAPDKSKIVVASQYLFQHHLEGAGMMEERDVAGRLLGIQVIEGVRRALRM